MIKEQELRIGNHVIYKSIQMVMQNKNGDWENYEEPHQLHTIQVNADHLKNMETNASHYQPIPLTEEWLLKFGFKESIHNWFGLKYFTECEEHVEEMKIEYNIVSNRLAIYDAIEETDMVNILSYPIYTAKKIQYVHQLQNLYFALTGEELTSKLVNNEQ